MTDATARAVEVPAGAEFECFVSNLLGQLDAARLSYVRQRADDLLNGDATPCPTSEDEREAQRQAAAKRGREALARSQTPEAREEIRRGFREFMKQAGIEEREPVGTKALREMMLRDGVRPEDNEFSRAIIAMREE